MVIDIGGQPKESDDLQLKVESLRIREYSKVQTCLRDHVRLGLKNTDWEKAQMVAGGLGAEL